MSLIPSISNPYLAAFLGGLTYGMVVCTASCLPYIASYIAGIGAGFRRGVAVTMIFNGGRIVGYALIGAVAGLLGGLLKLALSETTFSSFQIYSSVAFGIVTILIGVFVLVKYKSSSCDCTSGASKGLSTNGRWGRFGFDFGAFSLGLSRGLILCPPLVVLLLYAVPFSSPIGTVGLAVLFGVGTTISPILVLGGVTGWLLNKAPLFRKWISIAGGATLILLGIVALINSIISL